MGWRHRAVVAFDRVGGPTLVGRWFGRDRLTVLAYHRVIDHSAPGFVGFVGNVSASPAAFREQMRLVASRYNPVSLGDVVASLEGAALPERPALVTFDDGYRDNLDEALPVLAEHAIPATVFLATDHIGSNEPFWWDHAAWMIAAARVRPSELALLGSVDWDDPDRLAARWIQAAKRLPDRRKHDAIARLAEELDASHPGSLFSGSHLDWDAVRVMQQSGVTFGAHTCSHPILSRLEPEDVAREVRDSVAVVAAQTGRSPLGFAYPNGLVGDFDDAAMRAVADAGIEAAFTLVPGPARRAEVLADPLQIRRVYIHHHDDRARFLAKLAGIPRIVR